MPHLPQKPYRLLLPTGLILLVVSLSTVGVLVDIHLLDTFYVFPFAMLSWIAALVFLVAGMVYEFTQRFLYSNILTWTHIIWTIVMSVLVMAGIYLASYPEMVVDLRSGFDANRERDTFRIVSSLTKTAIISFFILAVGQLTFLVNILVGLYTWFKKRD